MSKQLMKGNEALAEAALRAGCRFYSGYPITPQTEILEYLAKRMDEVGGTFVQTESELAGINMLLGAAAAGARALTSSAGPGFSLNQEGISYLVAADLPAVIINVMRIGTGLGDIAQGQGDYWQMTRGGGHGDYRTIVLAPASVQENCDMMTTAFDLAEKYRHPVLVASDAAIGQMVEGVELKDFVEHDINQYDWAIRGCKAGQAPRKVQNVYYTNPQYPEFLRSKYQAIEDNEQRWESYQAEDADVVLVAYGISSRISKEAVNMARAEGFKLGLIRPITLWPYPVKAFETCKNAKAFMTVEINILGQMVDDVKLAVENKYPVGFYGTFFGLPEPEEILALGLSTIMSFFTSMDSYTRCIAARDARTARTGTIYAAVLVLIIAGTSTFLGMAGKLILPDLSSSNNVIAALVVELFPHGLKGLVLIGVLSAIMSTADISVLTGSASLTKDIYQRYINPNASDKTLLRVGFGASLFVGVLGAIFGWFTQDIMNILLITFTINSAGLFLPTLGAFFWKKSCSAGAFASMLSATVIAVVWFIGGKVSSLPLFSIDALWPSFGVSAILYVVICLTHHQTPAEQETAEKFYAAK